MKEYRDSPTELEESCVDKAETALEDFELRRSCMTPLLLHEIGIYQQGQDDQSLTDRAG